MGSCEFCGKDVELPFRCNFCAGHFCINHRLPESHDCRGEPSRTPLGFYESKRTIGNANQTKPKSIVMQSNGDFHFIKKKSISNKSHRKKSDPTKLIVAIVVVILTSVLLLLWLRPALDSWLVSNSTSSIPQTNSYEELRDYALSLINSNRQSKSLQNVTLSSVDSGQKHADDMLKQGYFSHWDTQGFKPYMRYTMAGGKGAMSENCAWMSSSGTITDVAGTLGNLERNMMYDDASSDWGHRDNILNPLHNKVSIGIAYDRNHVYLVQDFEDDYISWSTLSLSSEVVMDGTMLKTDKPISQVGIYFDNPLFLTIQQVSNPPYQGSYDAGTYVGMVVPPPRTGSQYEQPKEGILIVANAWSQNRQEFQISYDMTMAFAKYGRGVYTLYLWTDSNNCFTSLSILY